MEARFRAQLAEASAAPDGRVPISPSGMQNPVVTERSASSPAGARQPPVDVPGRVPGRVAVRAPVPVALAALKGQLPAASLELRFALLSIRHTEMDAVVDGAWLRNAEVSRPRPAGQTDDLVYDITRRSSPSCAAASRTCGCTCTRPGWRPRSSGSTKRWPTTCSATRVGVGPADVLRGAAPPKPGSRTRAGRHAHAGRGGGALFRRGTPWTM